MGFKPLTAWQMPHQKLTTLFTENQKTVLRRTHLGRGPTAQIILLWYGCWSSTWPENILGDFFVGLFDDLVDEMITELFGRSGHAKAGCEFDDLAIAGSGFTSSVLRISEKNHPIKIRYTIQFWCFSNFRRKKSFSAFTWKRYHTVHQRGNPLWV